jgi:C_GCAxxG_C_C family probable redox protein
MWETYDLKDEDILWAGIAFNGGIAGNQLAPCGAVSAATLSVGLLHRCSMDDKQKAKQQRLDAREDAGKLVNGFKEKFGAITCRELMGIDFSKPEAYRAFRESGVAKEKCDRYVEFVIEKLYEFDEKRGITRVPVKTVLYTRPGCPFCADAKKDLKERGVVYEEISIENNPKAIADVMRLSNGSGIVPILISGDEVKVGFGGG